MLRRIGRLLLDVFWLVVAGAVIAGGVLGFRQLEAIAPVVEPTPTERPIATVETMPLELWASPIPVRGTGFISPFRTLSLASERGGRIVALHDALDSQGSFLKGEVLVKLEDSGARTALAQADANLITTQARLDLVKTQLDRARALKDRGVISQDVLDQLLSQENELSSSIDSLNAAREIAQIALDQTTIEAPFAGTVSHKHSELGSVVGVGQPVADIYTSDTLEVTVALREEAAALVPELFTNGNALATVTSRFAGQDLSWPAWVIRVDSELDPNSRSLDVTVRLASPNATNGEDHPTGAPPALINSFAEVTIDGLEIEGLYAVPSTALYQNGSVVWLAVDGRLDIHPASLVHVKGEQSFVRLESVAPNARLIVSPLDLAIDGMPVREANEERDALAANGEI